MEMSHLVSFYDGLPKKMTKNIYIVQKPPRPLEVIKNLAANRVKIKESKIPCDATKFEILLSFYLFPQPCNKSLKVANIYAFRTKKHSTKNDKVIVTSLVSLYCRPTG